MEEGYISFAGRILGVGWSAKKTYWGVGTIEVDLEQLHELGRLLQHDRVNPQFVPVIERGIRALCSDVLGRAGYDTAAFVGQGSISAVYGLDQGFDVFEEHRKTSGSWTDLVQVTDVEPGKRRMDDVQGELIRLLAADVVRETVARARAATPIRYAGGVVHFDPDTPASRAACGG